jgi:hypothetical protein
MGLCSRKGAKAGGGGERGYRGEKQSSLQCSPWGLHACDCCSACWGSLLEGSKIGRVDVGLQSDEAPRLGPEGHQLSCQGPGTLTTTHGQLLPLRVLLAQNSQMQP